MSRFISVHSVEDASTILINVDTIEYVEKNEDYTGASFIVTTNANFDVTETREQILTMLQQH